MSVMQGSSDHVKRDILDPAACRKIVPTLKEEVWVYRYTHTEHGWTLCIGTHLRTGQGSAGHNTLMLGGFRIVPELRASLPGFSPEHEAIDLAVGMEEKVYWSRLIGVAGPLARARHGDIVGGKCVLLPGKGARVGEPLDFELLDFAIYGLIDFEKSSGVSIVTGQDLGHGLMSDEKTTSLDYLHRGFPGSIISDTSKPTAEGNFCVLKGMLRAAGLELKDARIGLIGVGNIGDHLVMRLAQHSSTAYALEASPAKRQKLEGMVKAVYAPEQKTDFLKLQLDALTVNANGGSLDDRSIELICANPSIRVVCGSENLAMPNPEGEEILLKHGKVFCHTELGGMMGYLTAVEEYLTVIAGQRFVTDSMYKPAEKLESVGFEAAREVLKNNCRESFTSVVRRLKF